MNFQPFYEYLLLIPTLYQQQLAAIQCCSVSHEEAVLPFMHFCNIKRGIGWMEANSSSVVVVLISKALLGLVRCRRANGSAKVKMVCEFMNEVPCVAVTWYI